MSYGNHSVFKFLKFPIRIDYDSNDSWNSNDKIGDCHIIADDIDDFDDENLLICKEKMEDSNSQDGFNDELENR